MGALIRYCEIVRSAWGSVKDYAVKSFRLYFKGLSASEKRFIDENARFWNSFQGASPAAENGYIFVRPEYYPLILVGNAHLCALAAARKHCRLLFLLRSRFDRSMKKVLGSFPNATFEYQDSPRHFFYWALSYFDARRAMRRLHSPEDLLALSVEGVPAGDLIYDSYLDQGFATVRDLKDPLLLSLMRYFFFQKRIISGILKRYRVIMGLTGHNACIDAGIFMRFHLKKNIEVWVYRRIIKKYFSLSNLYEDMDQPDERFFEHMCERKPYFAALADSILEDRMTKPNTAFGADLAYLRSKKVYSSRQDFAGRFSLDPDKKNVFVMLSIFNDGPHMCGPIIFNDYYHWFREVLKHARGDRSVNWIFKEHPFAWYYKIRDVSLEKIFADVKEPNILFLRETDSVSTASLRYLADVILSCFGTAGLEFSCFGIPCVLAGHCHYSHFGFTINPKSRAEYLKSLADIGTLSRLPEEKISIAKLIAFFSFEMCNLEKMSDPFRTVVTLDANEQVSIGPDKVFDVIVAARNKASQEAKMAFITAFNEFISNRNFTQFIDLDKHGFRSVLIRSGARAESGVPCDARKA